MWSNFVQYSMDPHLVARIQEFFGVEIHFNNDKANKVKGKWWTKSEDILSNAQLTSQTINGYTIQETKNTIKERHNEVLQSSKQDVMATNYNKDIKPYVIKNRFWYYLFLFGTELGDEIFYITFVTFWFWNLDAIVGRKIISVWAIIMTIGQILKDVICWPRPPSPPVVRLQSRWSLEYGMPSTHAIVGISIPFSAILFTKTRYIYPVATACIIAVLWCTLIIVSRLYLGMHTVLDVIVGLILAMLLMVPLVPLVDATDHYFFTNNWALSALIVITILTIIYYPCSDKWTPTRGDTTIIVAVTAGFYAGAWLNYKTGVVSMSQIPPPYNIMWPSFSFIMKTALRTIFGICSVLISRAIFKSLSYVTVCAILRINSKELKQSEDSLENKNKILVDLVHKYITYFLVGFVIIYLLPKIFSMIGIERSTFYEEL